MTSVITTLPSPVLKVPRFVIATPLNVLCVSYSPLEVATLVAVGVMYEPPPPPDWLATVVRAPPPPEYPPAPPDCPEMFPSDCPAPPKPPAPPMRPLAA